MSATPEPVAIGYAPGQYVPPAPPPAAVAALLARAERATTETGVLVRPLPDADPAKADPPDAGATFTRAEARAIQLAADAFQRASEAHREAAAFLVQARKDCEGSAPPPTPPDVQRADALAYIDGT